MQFTPVSPSTIIDPLDRVMHTYEGFKTVNSFIESGFKNLVESQQGLIKKVTAVALSAFMALVIALSAVPLILHLTFKVIQSNQFEFASTAERTIAKLGAIAMLPGVAVAFVLFAMKELIKKTAEFVKEPDHHENVYVPHDPLKESVDPMS